MDANDLSALIGRIYAAGLDVEDWSSVLVDVAAACGGESAALVLHDPQLHLSSVTAPSADPEVIAAYTSQWWQHDPTSAATSHIAPGVITTLDTTGRDLFMASAFYNEFWRHSGLGSHRVASNLLAANGAFASCVIHAARGRDETDATTVAHFGLLLPHLMQAVQIQRSLWRSELATATMRAAPFAAPAGTVLVDADCRLLFADEGAEHLLLSGRLPLFVQRELALSGAPARLVRQQVADCAKDPAALGRRVRVSPPEAPGFVLEVIPYLAGTARRLGFVSDRPVALILVHDRATREDLARRHLQLRYGLTPAEATLALEIAKGDGRDAAAARLGVTLSTARTHLSRIFEKTGASRQAELVLLLTRDGL